MAVLELEGVSKTFTRAGRPPVHAVNTVSLVIEAGQTVALIGESGSGKSTLGRIAVGLMPSTTGQVSVGGVRLSDLGPKGLRRMRSQMQMVFQEPYQSLNPRKTVGATVLEPLNIHSPKMTPHDKRNRVLEVLDQVGLPDTILTRYPRALSGGQQQRVGIARAIVTNPKLIILDEPTSSLDLSVRAQILNLLAALQREHGIAYLFISHDISTVQHVSDRVMVMYLGRVVESGNTASVLAQPRHPYTKALMAACLSVDPNVKQDFVPLKGDSADPTRQPQGCVLSGRCPIEVDACKEQPVPLRDVANGESVACIESPGYFAPLRKL